MPLLDFDELSLATFSVDPERRTMTGVAVPWGGISTPKDGRRYRFSRGSLKYTDPKFVKLLEDHNRSLRRGRATTIEDTDAGLVVTFKVNDGPHGDRVLALAKTGAKKGLSVGVEFSPDDAVPDPDNPGVWLVNLANLEEVSHVRLPSFDGAELISVTASAEGDGMPCQTCGQVHADGVACTAPTAPPATVVTPQPVMFSADQLAWMQANGFGAAPAPVSPAQPERPAEIPQRRVATVTEPTNYQFSAEGDLQPAKYDFGVDMVRGMNPKFNDLAARQRLEEFVAAQFAVVTTDVNELSPTVNVPRYIDQRDYRSPVWNAINKGAPPNGVQPFAWPLFSSASGLVGAHTEGTEPTSGSYVTTNQTVTPGAVSGKAKISRETWDLGGTPGIGGLIWKQMTRGYAEALEAKAIATLDAATPTGITFTTAGGTTGQTLAAELVAAFAKLQFVRGGFSMDNLFAQIDLYLAVVGAKDGNGAYLFPALGPTNRDGTVSQRFGSVDINGVTMVPSWALAATGVVAASSYLFDSDSVDGWATPPRELLMPEIEVANVYVGIWGYSAAAINDITGVRELIYDPA